MNRSFVGVLAAIGFWAVLFVSGMVLGWPGELNPCAEPPYCYCERVRPGPVAQPANTVSDLGFVLGALFIAWDAGRRRRRGIVGRFGSHVGYVALYSQVALFMGPGSMFFHGAMTDWGGRLDGLSMYLFILFVILYQIAASYDWGWRRFVGGYAGVVAVFGLERAVGPDTSVPVFAGLVTIAVLWECVVAIPVAKWALGRKRDRALDRRWLLSAVGLFLVALVIWTLSDSGRPLCDPDSLIQGHAIWHLLSAGSVVSIYLYFESEPAAPSPVASTP